MSATPTRTSQSQWLKGLGKIGMGTVPLGNLYSPISEVEAKDTVDAAWQAGIRMFDTAPVYGYGLAERRLGQALCDHSRADLVVSTKVGRLLVEGGVDDSELVPNGQALFVDTPMVRPVFDFSRSATLRSIEESLVRLQLDHVDIVYIHDPDDHYAEAMEGAYPTLDELRRQGIVRAIGVGMTRVPRLLEFAVDGDFDLFLIAGRYSLLDTAAGSELLPMCEARGIGVAVGGVFNSGILAAPDASPTFDYQPASEVLREKTRRLATICERHGVPLGAAAIQFPLRHPAVSCVLLGMRSAKEVESNLRMAKLPIPAELWADLYGEGLLDEHSAQ